MSRAPRFFTTLVFVVAASAVGAPAVASPVTWLLTGTVSSSSLPGISVGDPASMLMTFESSAPDSEPSPGCGLYLGALQSMTTTFGSQTFVGAPGLGIEVSTGSGSVVACGIMPGNFAGYAFRMGISPYLIAFFEGGPVFSDALPLVPPGGSYSGFRAFSMFTPPYGCCGPNAVADLRSAQVVPAAVPEPATLILLGTGIASAFGMRRRRH